MANFVFRKWIRGILYCLLSAVISYGVAYILFSVGIDFSLSALYILSAVITLVCAFVILLLLWVKKQDPVYVYPETKFWSHTKKRYTRAKTILCFWPMILTAAAAVAAAIALYPVLSQAANRQTPTALISQASVLSSAAVFLTVYALYMILWCFRAACPHCKSVMSRRCISVSNDRTYTESREKSETRRETIGKLKAGDREIADIQGDVTYRYTQKVKVRKWTEDYRCSYCKHRSSSNYTDEKTENR